jgi:hypothetical protein
MRQALWFLSAVVLIAALPNLVMAQQQSTELTQVAGDAGIIFRGEVIAVQLESPRAPDEMALTRVTFRIKDGVRGATTGGAFIIRQWNAAPDEYRVGESLILFLHSPSRLGTTSPVGGRAGHRRVDEVPQEFLNSLRAPATKPCPAPVPPRLIRPSHASRELTQ